MLILLNYFLIKFNLVKKLSVKPSYNAIPLRIH